MCPHIIFLSSFRLLIDLKYLIIQELLKYNAKSLSESSPFSLAIHFILNVSLCVCLCMCTYVLVPMVARCAGYFRA